MKIQIIGVKFHDFQIVNQANNFVLARCTCCSKARFAVYKISERSKMFYYHGLLNLFLCSLSSIFFNNFSYVWNNNKVVHRNKFINLQIEN